MFITPINKEIPLPTIEAKPSETIKKGRFIALLWNPLPKVIIDQIRDKSWKDNNPVHLRDLAYIQVSHWNMDGEIKDGEFIYHKTLALEIIDIFQELFENKFPIQHMRLVDHYDAKDELSMGANNSSAFCSRAITSKTGVFSKHSYGCAIDLNPLINPYWKGDLILPKGSDEFLNRDLNIPGLIKENEACYLAFAKRGYTWGGNWDKPYKDYHHFEKDPNDLLQL